MAARITYSPEERKARMEGAHADLTAAVEAISTSEDWTAFLDFARKLHSYSAQNRMWLFQQAMMRGWDELGYVAGFKTWLALDRHVRKGETSLKVLAPVRVKVTDEDGEHWAIRGFKVESVFAQGQTDGDGDVPERISPVILDGDGPEGAYAVLESLAGAQGFTVKRESLFPANGTTSFQTHVVVVADRLDGAAAVKTLAHELAHVLLHENADYHANRARCEVEAESVAYLVCRELGLETDQYSFPYVATWANGETKVVTQAADIALKCATEILERFSVAAELVDA